MSPSYFENVLIRLTSLADTDEPFFEILLLLFGHLRAGLAVVDVRRFIFIPPCEYVRDLDYHGKSLLGAVQREVPPLQA